MNTSSVEKKFVYLAIIFGMIIMVLTPPFQAPDENKHVPGRAGGKSRILFA